MDEVYEEAKALVDDGPAGEIDRARDALRILPDLLALIDSMDEERLDLGFQLYNVELERKELLRRWPWHPHLPPSINEAGKGKVFCYVLDDRGMPTVVFGSDDRYVKEEVMAYIREAIERRAADAKAARGD
jgi:hypothetical protein